MTETRSYDDMGRLSFTNDSAVKRDRVYSRTGALTVETITFKDGAVVKRQYQYNRCAQRTLATDSIYGVTLSSGDATGKTEYFYSNGTGRLDSLRSWAGTGEIARVRWLYDRGGRDTLRAVRLSGGSSEVLQTRKAYDGPGRLDRFSSSTPGIGTWYDFDATNYRLNDDLIGSTFAEATTSPSQTVNYGQSYAYEANGTGRLVTSDRSTEAADYGWSYDVFGNRLSETSAGECGTETLQYATDNALKRGLCNGKIKTYGHDRAGNRLFQIDSAGGTSLGIQSVMTYTARNQLFFSMTPTAQTGTWDFNWHWYDGAGLRAITHVSQGSGWTGTISPSGGIRTYYVYDGADVALTLVKKNNGQWIVHQRYVVGGLDDVVAGRFSTAVGASGPVNLALVSDRQGSTLHALKADGTRETQSTLFSRNPFGMEQGASGVGGDVAAGTGFAGASTPNATGGFTYLRNRWYDPKTGRFLTQDPIGLAGGINLYAYAGNDPVAFSDPFGLNPIALALPTIGRFGLRLLAGAILTGLALEVNEILSSAFAKGYQASAEAAANDAPERSIENPGSLAGATPEEVAKAVPDGWVKSPSREGGGTRWLNPDRVGEAVRVQPGNPRDPNPTKQGPYVRVSKDGRVSDPIPLKGNPTLPQQ